MKREKQFKPLDKNTFGDSKAEIALADLLTKREDPYLIEKVGKLMEGCISTYKALQDVERGTRVFLFSVLRDKMLETVEKSKILQANPDIATYVRNCLTKRMRIYLLHNKRLRA